MITVKINGAPYIDFVSKSVQVALNQVSNSFSLVASAVDGYPPLRQGDKVAIDVDGVLVLTGEIDEVDGSVAEGQHLVTYTGRDKTADLIDSQLDNLADLRASNSLTLKRVIETVLGHIKLNIDVEDELNPAPFNDAEDILSPRPGQGALEFVIGYCRKRQALLSSTGEGNLLIAQSRPADSGAVLESLLNSDTNNVLSQSWRVEASQLFNRYVRKGQLDPRALNFAGESSAKTVESQSGQTVDSDVRLGRQQVVVESESYSSEQLKDRSKWAKRQAQAKAVQFNCVVKGHSHSNGTVWVPNTLVQVNSEYADISRPMLLQNVTFSEGEGQPTTTSLEFVEKYVYAIAERLTNQRPVGSQNDAFTNA